MCLTTRTCYIENYLFINILCYALKIIFNTIIQKQIDILLYRHVSMNIFSSRLYTFATIYIINYVVILIWYMFQWIKINLEYVLNVHITFLYKVRQILNISCINRYPKFDLLSILLWYFVIHFIIKKNLEKIDVHSFRS